MIKFDNILKICLLTIISVVPGTVSAQTTPSWAPVGTAGFSTGVAGFVKIAFNPATNEPYVAYQDANNAYKATVMKFNGSSWVLAGTAGFSIGAANYIRLAFNPSTNEPYVVYRDDGNGYKSTVMKFNGSSWVPVGTAGFSVVLSDSFSLAFNPSTSEPYVVQSDNLNADKATVVKFNGTSWVPVGTAVSAGKAWYTNIAFNPSTNEPYVVYQDYVSGQKVIVMKFNGTSWVPVGTGGNYAHYTSIAFNPATNEPYVVYKDVGNAYKATVMKFNGTSWTPVGTAGFSAGDADQTSIAFNPSTNEPYVVYKDGVNASKATVMKFNGSSWVLVGTAGFGAGVDYSINLAFNPSTNEPYVAYQDTGNGSKSTVMKFNQGSSVPPPTTNPPSVTTGAASSIATTGATLAGTITALGDATPTARGIVYGLTSSYGNTVPESGSFSTGAYTKALSGLTCGTIYHYAAYATNTYGTTRGSDATFMTSACVVFSTTPLITADAPLPEVLHTPDVTPPEVSNDSHTEQITPSTTPAFSRVLYYGTKGSDVTKLQQRLVSEHLLRAENVTGFYGNLTRLAVQEFQCNHGISCSGDATSTGYGVVGPKTVQAITGQTLSLSTSATPTPEDSPASPTLINSSTSQSQNNNLSYGSRGARVTFLQQKLSILGYLAPENVTGFYGQKTQDAVAHFQCNKGIVCAGTPASTGYKNAGPKTQKALGMN